MRASGDDGAAYWSFFLENSVRTLAPNLRVKAGVVRCRERIWPLTVEGELGENSYPCSLFTQYVRYPLAELSLLKSKWAQAGAWSALQFLGVGLRFGQVDQTVQWSSSLLSTNLHGSDLVKDAPTVTTALTKQFPNHAILLKNIHAFEDPELPSRLEACGYDLITSRQIYFFDGKNPEFLSRSDVKRDLKALRALKSYSVVESDSFFPEDIPRITALYRMLYLEKHSYLNPQYTEKFVARALNERLLEFRGLRHESGRLDAVFACFQKGRVTTTPFIGYDTTLTIDTGFYRLLVAMLLKRVAEQRLLLNYSSGAGEFKRRRGAQAGLEWNAVYVRHLPPDRRIPYQVLGALMNRWGKRFLVENGV